MQPIALDTHAHIAPIAPGLAGLPGVTWDPASHRLTFADGGALESPKVFQPEALLAWMDANQVARAWISAPPPLYRMGLDEPLTRQWTQWLNAALAEAAARHPARLAPMFHLPVQFPALAAELAAATISLHPGHRRFAMAAGSARSGTMLSEPAYEPLWSALSGATLLLHPVGGTDPRLDRFFLHNLLGGPGETALAAAHLAMSAMPERHPAVRIILAHGGGSTPAVAGRLERGQHVRRPGADTGALPARTAMRAFHADSITHAAPALHLAAETFGPAHIVFGSDWPFSMGLIDPHAQLADVEPTLRARIFANDLSRDD